VIAIVSDDFEGDLIFLFLCFGGIVSGSKAQSDILG
jgi:hypothetical protein